MLVFEEFEQFLWIRSILDCSDRSVQFDLPAGSPLTTTPPAQTYRFTRALAEVPLGGDAVAAGVKIVQRV